jgi:hypothetical protein
MSRGVLLLAPLLFPAHCHLARVMVHFTSDGSRIVTAGFAGFASDGYAAVWEVPGRRRP